MRDPENEAYDAGYDCGRRHAEARFDGAHAALVGRLKTAEAMRDALLKSASEGVAMQPPSPIVVLDASPSEATGERSAAEQERAFDNWWHSYFMPGKDGPGPVAYVSHRQAFFTGAALYSAPPAGDGVPRVTEEDVALIRDAANRNLRSTSDRCHKTGKQYARILAVLEAVSARKGGGNG